MTHELAVRVWYEDTDLAGIVYYANYLKYIERGRSDLVARAGVDQGALARDGGLVFAVREVHARYLAPARLGDDLTVRTTVYEPGPVRMVFDQAVWRGEVVLFTATVTVVCVHQSGRPLRVPAEIRQKIETIA